MHGIDILKENLTDQSMFDFDRECLIPLIIENNLKALNAIKQHPAFTDITCERYRKVLDALLKAAIDTVENELNKQALADLIKLRGRPPARR